MKEGLEGIVPDYNHFYFHDNLNFFFDSTQGGMLFVFIEHLTFRTLHMTAKDKVKLVRWLIEMFHFVLCLFILFRLLPPLKQIISKRS